ncbi:MAG: response regulator [candidate division Zixibacteria bacterium]|nr:response regulator [candidate division Zixibacteria bacterium]
MIGKILVIDDAPIIRDFLSDVLTDWGFTVDSAENGKIGYEMAVKNEYTVVFCDVHMPVMNGVQTVIQLKQAKPELPIIMTDSYPEKQVEQAIREGAIRCLNKPFDLDDLKSAVNSIIRNQIPSLK